MSDLTHVTSRLCRAPVAHALAHLGTPAGLARWSLGLSGCSEADDGLLTGTSLFDGARGWVRVVRLPGMDAIEYHLGAAPDRLVPRIHARVVDGEPLGHGAGTCLVILLAWRPQGMSDERWRRLVASHEAEIELIRAQLESAADTPPAGA